MRTRRDGLARLVVDAHHRNVGVRGGLGVEQPRLGVEVVLHRRMEVQVVAGQIGEPAHGEVHGVDPAQGQRVAGHLHHDGVDAALDHHGEQRLQVGGLRGGERAGLVAPVDPDADGADQAGDPAGGPQPGLHQIGRGGLARGAGHADDAHALRRVAVDGARPPRRAPPAASGAPAPARRRRRRSARRPSGRSAPRPPPARRRRRRSAAPCDDGTGQRGEQVAGTGVLAAQRDPGDRDVRGGRTASGRGRDPFGQRREVGTDRVRGTQIHGVDTVPAWPTVGRPVLSGLQDQRRPRIGRQRHVLPLQQPGGDVVEQRRRPSCPAPSAVRCGLSIITPTT